MKSIRTSFLLLLSSLQFMGGKAFAVSVEEQAASADTEGDAPVSLRPLNIPADNLFAGHRSHSSHASHASHRSGSGGGYVPLYQPPPPKQYFLPTPPASDSAQPTDPGRPAPVAPLPWRPATPTLTAPEKLTLQIMRVQIALTSLGLYSGSVNGVLDTATKESISHFQTVKGLPPNGLMTTDTLNALGVPAVQ
jgi:His-Xaa-Ser repeat protein HxsA